MLFSSKSWCFKNLIKVSKIWKKIAPAPEVPTGRTLGFLDQEAVPFHQTRGRPRSRSGRLLVRPKDKAHVLWRGNMCFSGIVFLELQPYRDFRTSSAWREFNYCFPNNPTQNRDDKSIILIQCSKMDVSLVTIFSLFWWIRYYYIEPVGFIFNVHGSNLLSC